MSKLRTFDEEYSKFRDDYDMLCECRFYQEDQDAADFLAECRAEGINRLEAILQLVEHQKETITELRLTLKFRVKEQKINRIGLFLALFELLVIFILCIYIGTGP